MTSSKRLRIVESPNLPHSKSEDVLFNLDLLSIIFTNFRVFEILKIIQTNQIFYQYIKSNEKSYNMIKHVLSHDFGDIFASKAFKFPTA